MVGALPGALTRVTSPHRRSFQAPVRNGVVVLLLLLALAGCTPNGPLAPKASHSPTPSPIESPSPSPSPSPTAQASPVTVPAWAALRSSCSSTPASQEAIIKLQGSSGEVLAD